MPDPSEKNKEEETPPDSLTDYEDGIAQIIEEVITQEEKEEDPPCSCCSDLPF
jgi:hypothetical protein